MTDCVPEDSLLVEVVYGTVEVQELVSLVVEQGANVQQAIQQSGLLVMFDEIDLSVNKVGVFGQIVRLDDLLQAGDRIEIYRPLQADPRLARRQRVQQSRGLRAKS